MMIRLPALLSEAARKASRNLVRSAGMKRGIVGFVFACLLAGCRSTPPPPARVDPLEARPVEPRRVEPPLPASVAGRWTRAQDGTVFSVTDDGAEVRGTLATDPGGVYEAFSFALGREGGRLVGKAKLQPKVGPAAETAWLLRGDGDDRLVGENEVLALDPDTGEVVKALGTRRETQGFAIARPAPEPPAPPKAPEAEAPQKAPEAPVAQKTPDAPAPETPTPQKAPEAPSARTAAELLRAVFDALHAGDLKALQALAPDQGECATLAGADRADGLSKQIAARLEEDFARFIEENAGIHAARFLEASPPEPKQDPDCASAQLIESPELAFEMPVGRRGGPRKVTLNLFVKVGDGGWKIVSLLPKR